MSVLTINNSNPKLEWTRLPDASKKKDDLTLKKSPDLNSFTSEFPSPVDEIKARTNSNSETPKTDKKKRPFSYTSENWIG